MQQLIFADPPIGMADPSRRFFVKKNLLNFTGLGKKRTVSTNPGTDATLVSSREEAKTLVNMQPIQPQQLMYGCGQSVGKQREHNEDSVLAFSVAYGDETNRKPFGLFMVADGMGGHQYGEIASSTAVRTFTGCILKYFQDSLADPAVRMDESVQDLIRSAVQEAQNAVRLAAPGSGTTVTAALVLGQQVTIGHVGDSRAYVIHPNGEGEALTHDHSLVKRMEELGQITSEEAAIHPQRNVLYRALGQGEALEPDIFTVQFQQSDRLLLCSDGLWSVVSDQNLFNLAATASDLHAACKSLLAAANDAGGPDNISVILVKHA
jgi:serine/threonine protein phosphatase PrpC